MQRFYGSPSLARELIGHQRSHASIRLSEEYLPNSRVPTSGPNSSNLSKRPSFGSSSSMFSRYPRYGRKSSRDPTRATPHGPHTAPTRTPNHTRTRTAPHQLHLACSVSLHIIVTSQHAVNRSDYGQGFVKRCVARSWLSVLFPSRVEVVVACFSSENV